VHYVVWRRPDETRHYSPLLIVSHPESCLFRLIINNMIFCLIETEYSLRESVSAQGREGRGFDSDPGRNLK
jgi:hypothetical protein